MEENKDEDDSGNINQFNLIKMTSENTIQKLSLIKEEEKEKEKNKNKNKDFISEEDLYENINESDISSDLQTSSSKELLKEKENENENKNQKSINEIFYLSDIKDFDPKEYSIRKYDKNNIELGKLFFKYRFIKKKIEKFAGKNNLRMTTTATPFPRSGTIFDKRFSIPFRGSNNKSFGLNMNNINKKEEIFNNKSEYRKYNSDFLVLIEKSIFNFNLKKFEESYKILFRENIVYSEKEFGEILLVINGYNKYILANFLAKDKAPNDKKEVINGFINSIDLKYQQKSKINSFLECLKFFLSRLKLPEDSNLILQIMDVFSTCLFNTNKENEDFIKKYPSINAIYLLISTILALNTMLTRKDIKNMNIIKKEQFIELNKEIDSNEAQDIYEQLEKEPISMKDNYSENNYKRMTILVKKKDIKDLKDLKDLKKNTNMTRSKTVKENDNDEKKNEIIDINENLKINNLLENRNGNIEEVEEEKEKEKEMDKKKYQLSEKLVNKFNDLNIAEEENENENSIDSLLRNPSFSYQANLESFSDIDKEILSKPTKFEKFVSKNSHHPRLFIVCNNMEKLTWAKDIEIELNSDKSVRIKKTKGTVHNLMITDIIDVFNGINNNSELINEYIKLFPEESKEADSFITIKTADKLVCLKANIQENAISWFKALKSLVILSKKNIENNKIELENETEQLKKLMKKKVSDIWNTFILPYWEFYGHYLQYKMQNKIYDKNKSKKDDITSKNGLIIEEKMTYSLKEKNQFIDEAKKKLNINYINILDYNEFFYLYSIGLPNNLRVKIWTLLIGNPCGLTNNLYQSYLGFINDIDFEELINEYNKNKTIDEFLDNCDEDENIKFIINQIIIDIIESKNLFKSKLANKEEDKILLKIYKIVRVFFLIRPDICYNKSIVIFSFIFLLIFKDEFISFKNIFNLICSTNTLQYYIKDENYINIRVSFFDYLLEKKIPKVREHFKNLDISTELFLISWFENIFALTLKFKLFKVIFDLYLLNGEYILFQVGLTIIKIQENEILNLTIGEILKNLYKLPEKYTQEEFLEKLHMININEEYEKWKIDGDVGNQKIKLLELVLLESK